MPGMKKSSAKLADKCVSEANTFPNMTMVKI